jgi:hypothetical protein
VRQGPSVAVAEIGMSQQARGQGTRETECQPGTNHLGLEVFRCLRG